MRGEQIGVRMIERAITLACIVLCMSVAGFFFYVLAVSIVGHRRLREPLTWEQFAINLCFLAGGLGFLAFALLFVIFSQEGHDIVAPIEVAQALKVAMIVLSASSVAIAIGAVAILLADHFLHRPGRSI
jgi:hypothetical protein